MKKNNKIIIAIFLAVVMACVFVACSHADKEEGKMITVTEAVTDEAGEVVTDAQGEVVTEIVEGEAETTDGGEIVTEVVTNQKKEPFTHKDGGYVTRVVVKTTSPLHKKTTTKKGSTTTKKGGTTTTKKGETASKDDETTTTTTTTTVVKQPNAPGKVTGFKVSSVTKDSVKLTWDKLDCDGYEILYSADGENEQQLLTTKTTETIKNLISYTGYTFKIRGYNEYAGGKKIATNNWVEVKATTKADEDNERQINLKCLLPVTGKADTLVIYVKEKGGKYKKDSEVKIDSCDGMTHTYKTKEKYKGLVQIKVVLKNAETQDESALTDKNTVSLDLTKTKIGMAEGVDD